MTESPDLSTMLRVIDLGARTTEDIFTGPPMPTPHVNAFGGQVLGQALTAAGATVPPGRELHSMHGYFLRPGDSREPMTFDVARLHDGRSFGSRRVQVYQNGAVLMLLIASFQDENEGVSHQLSFDMSSVPAPESLPSVWQKFGHLPQKGRHSWILGRPFDIRSIDPDITFEVSQPTHTQRVWLRSRELFDESPLFQKAALAFASDYLLCEPLLRQHGVPWATAGIRMASLDHAMWFHRPFRVDEWILYELESHSSQGGRGLTQGRFYSQTGVLIATVTQEMMIRFPVDAQSQ